VTHPKNQKPKTIVIIWWTHRRNDAVKTHKKERREKNNVWVGI
jgi:trehalose utilization protein